jgi:hypothetical protein
MFLDKRNIPLIATKCEALIRNLSPNHPKIPEISNEQSLKLAGYYGERSIDHFLGKLDMDKYDIIPGIRLKNKDRYFQIDALLLSNYFWLPIEIKNLTGDIEVNHAKGQMTQNKNGMIRVYDCPLSQAQHQTMQFIQLLKELKFPTIPIDFLVAFSNSNGNVSTVGYSDHYWKICRGINLKNKIDIFEKMYQTEIITTKERKKLAKLLLKKDEPLDVDILKRFTIPKEDIPTGVQCPSCLSIPMVYSSATWECPTCGEKSKTAHTQKIIDYFLIMNPTISNKQFREITHIKQRQTATRILNSMALDHQGTNKGRIYFPSSIQNPYSTSHH